jgi:ribose transport system substrate-binding protein
VQIVEDLLNRPDVKAIAISPSNAPLMAKLLKEKAPQIPIMTIDADLSKEDAALRKTYLGTDNYLMGVKVRRTSEDAEAGGRHGVPAARQRRRRQHQPRAAGTRDTLAGEKGIDRLKGEGGWTEIDGCPVFTNDQADLANQQMADTFTAKPDLTPSC